MAEFKKVANIGDIPVGQVKMVEINDTPIAIFNLNGQFYAIHNECTHVGAPLCEGPIEGDEVICPWHGARFNIKNGQATSPPAQSNLDCFEVRIQGNDLEIKV